MSAYKLLFLNTFFTLAVIGCAARPAPAPSDGFELRGKLAVEEASERYSASFSWRQEAERFDINIWGPLGQGRVHLRGDNEELQLVDGAGNVVQRGPGEVVMRDRLGWSMPLHVVSAWVLGRPDDRLPVTDAVRNETGQLVSFSQAGWQIRFAGYREVPLGAREWLLPRKIDAERPSTRVRLVIAAWDVGPDADLSL